MPTPKSHTPSSRRKRRSSSSQGQKKAPVVVVVSRSRRRRRQRRLSKLRGGVVAPSKANVAQLKEAISGPLLAFFTARKRLLSVFETLVFPDTMSVRSRDFIYACQTLDNLKRSHDETVHWLFVFTEQFGEIAYVRAVKSELAWFFVTYAEQVNALQNYCQTGKREADGGELNPHPGKVQVI